MTEDTDLFGFPGLPEAEGFLAHEGFVRSEVHGRPCIGLWERDGDGSRAVLFERHDGKIAVLIRLGPGFAA